MRFATYPFSKQTFILIGTPNKTLEEFTFQIPCSFGLGADIKISNGRL